MNENQLNPEQVIDERAAVFHALVTQAEDEFEAGRLQDAAAYAQIAATYAMNQHAGVFASTRLERLLITVSNRAFDASAETSVRPRLTRKPECVLHIFSLSWSIGGHSRMVWRWVNADSSRSHSVAITHQGTRPVPAQLVDAVRLSGGSVHLLDRTRGDLLTWARRLRSLAQQFDLVVLHSNPDDVIPNLAFAKPDGLPAIVVLNHADHVFWLGTTISTVVAHQRRSGMDLSTERRGVDARRNAMLPIVVDAPDRAMDRVAARRSLGLPDDAVILLSVARGHKFEPLESPWDAANELSFPDCIVPLIVGHPEAVMVAVGPEPDDRWRRASEVTQGRILALGPRDPAFTYYEAADIYVDSFPVTSITSMLEAAGYGLPLVTAAPFPPGCEVFESDTPGLDTCVLRASSASDLVATLAALIVDPEIRVSRGEAARSSVATVHTGPGWKHYLDRLYLQVAGMDRSPSDDCRDPAPMAADVDVLLCQLFRGGPDLQDTLIYNLGNMSHEHRLRTWRSLRSQKASISPGLLLPAWLAFRLEHRRQTIGNHIGRFSISQAWKRPHARAHDAELGANT